MEEGDILILNAASDGKKTYIHKAGNVGDGVASTFTVNHTLNTQDLIVQIKDTSDGYKDISPASVNCKSPTTSTITLDFGAEVPTTNQYRIVIKKAV